MCETESFPPKRTPGKVLCGLHLVNLWLRAAASTRKDFHPPKKNVIWLFWLWDIFRAFEHWPQLKVGTQRGTLLLL